MPLNTAMLGFAALAAASQPLSDEPPSELGPAPSFQSQPIDAVFCHALTMSFAEVMATLPGDSARAAVIFERRAGRISRALVEQAGGGNEAEDAVRASLAQAKADLDIAAFDALVEEEAETIMVWCERLAGPDD